MRMISIPPRDASPHQVSAGTAPSGTPPPALQESLPEEIPEGLRKSQMVGLCALLWGRLSESLRKTSWENLSGGLREGLREGLWESLREEIRETFRASLREEICETLQEG